MKTRILLTGLFLGIFLSSIGVYLFMRQRVKNFEEVLFDTSWVINKQNEDIKCLLQLIQAHSFHLDDFYKIEYIYYNGLVNVNADGIDELQINYCSFLFDKKGMLLKASPLSCGCAAVPLYPLARSCRPCLNKTEKQ